MSPTKTAFTASTDSDSDRPDDDEYDEYVAFTAHTNRRTLPFEVWVKDKLCRNCNEVGHIQRDCPKPLRHTPRAPKSHRFRSKQESSRHTRHGGSSYVPPKQIHTPPAPRTKEYASKVQALISAACDLALTTKQDANESTSTTTTNDEQPSAHDYSGFLAALGCPKE